MQTAQPNSQPAWISPEITTTQYAFAVGKLMGIAIKDCSGSRASAQVLLSAYNGDAFQLDVTDLCVLDGDFYQAAITVIRGRAELRIEPQELMDNGNQLFENLWKQWQGYKWPRHIVKRGNSALPKAFA